MRSFPHQIPLQTSVCKTAPPSNDRLSKLNRLRAATSPVLKSSVVATSTSSVGAAPRPSSVYFLRTSPSPPPHLAAGNAQGHRGSPKRPPSVNPTVTAPLRTLTVTVTACARLASHRGMGPVGRFQPWVVSPLRRLRLESDCHCSSFIQFLKSFFDLKFQKLV
jgi:hypothetical protein